MEDRLLELILLTPAILFALVIHEYAHGLVADRLGDPTPRSAGRLTLNPIKHLDPIGTVMLFLVRIGWARPVPVNPSYFENPRLGMVWVSMAGPTANMLGALGCGLLLRVVAATGDQPGVGAFAAAVHMLTWGMIINLILAAFNLIPLPPLDGSKILAGILPASGARLYRRVERFGPILLLLLIILGRTMLWGYIRPFVYFFGRLFAGPGAAHIFSTL